MNDIKPRFSAICVSTASVFDWTQALMDVELEQAKREAALHARRREELDTLKQQRKERAKNSVTASFSGKQKKQQLRARKQRLASRRDEEAALDLQSAQYEEFYADKPAAIEEEEEDDEVEAFRAEPDFSLGITTWTTISAPV